MRILSSPLRRALAASLLAGGAIAWGSAASIPQLEHSPIPAVPLPEGLEVLEPGWKLRALRELPEKICSLVEWDDSKRPGNLHIYVGTMPLGGVYDIAASQEVPVTHQIVAQGMGDVYEHGTCSVNTLAVRDVDHDGVPELLAATCQVLPRGRPRLYVWSIAPTPVFRGMVRTDIRSSWSHGLGFVTRPGADSDSVFSTYCGYGEVVEYHLAREKTGGGFSAESLAWKQVAQLPASGETVLTADVDNDGGNDVCVATGYAFNGAAIHVYASPEQGSDLRIKHVINEDKRFGNVRFVVGPTRGDGLQDLFAWWCTGLGDVDCEFVRYRLGPEGVREREVLARGDAPSLWPKDGQTVLADLDQDGRTEVWFATDLGNLWRYDPSRPGVLSRVLEVPSGIGPIIRSTAPNGKPCLLLGIERRVVRLEWPAVKEGTGRVASKQVARVD